MARNFRISKWEKESTMELAKKNRIKKITELKSQIAELEKSPMIESSASLQKILNQKIAELKVLIGEENEL